ncbi:MAG: hypothetical protein JO139_10155 [Alphaproteobacteria bacterium]|nr:hypothetical protein [Alphaproteobacteria bacterium]MBV8337173.1 hypothetical protein [Alphaproteobacteria bacterium]
MQRDGTSDRLGSKANIGGIQARQLAPLARQFILSVRRGCPDTGPASWDVAGLRGTGIDRRVCQQWP